MSGEEQGGEMNIKLYSEIWVSNDGKTKPVLPDTCPICGATKVEGNDGTAFRAWREYACGGCYTEKPQIQTHTNKYWGSCQKGGQPDPAMQEIKH